MYVAEQTIEEIYGTTFARISKQFDLPSKTIPELQEISRDHWYRGMSISNFEIGTATLKELLRRGYSWDEAGEILK